MDKLYVNSTSNSWAVRLQLRAKLCSAAEAEILNSRGDGFIDKDEIFREARVAFESLSALLGHRRYFGKHGDPRWGNSVYLNPEQPCHVVKSAAEDEISRPGLLDAAVFAYTSLVFTDYLGFNPAANYLARELVPCENLIRHCRNVSLECYNLHM